MDAATIHAEHLKSTRKRSIFVERKSAQEYSDVTAAKELTQKREKRANMLFEYIGVICI